MTVERRRWFRFSLRTLFITMTLVALLPLGLLVSQMQRREALRDSLRSRDVTFGMTMQGRQRSKKPIAWLNPASWLKPVESIGVNSGKLSKDELDMLRRVFPEAEIFEYIPSIHLMPESRRLPEPSAA